MENKTASNYNDLPLKAPKLKGILLILFLVLLDQGTKYLAIRYLKGTSAEYLRVSQAERERAQKLQEEKASEKNS